MTKIRRLSLVLVAVLVSCTDKNATNSERVETDAPDAAVLTDLSPTQLRKELANAATGNVSAAKRLYDYYLARGDRNEAKIWSAWLIRHNDPDALAVGSEDRFRHARSLSDADPMKLKLLGEAVELYSRLPQGERRSEAIINGRRVDITEEQRKNRLGFGKSLRQEYERVRSVQVKEAERAKTS